MGIRGRFILCLLLFVQALRAQDTLPDFTVVAKGNARAIISWVNTDPGIKQISIQRSTDSLKNFKSIMTVADPELPQNGFADTKVTTPIFYRLFIVKDSGAYMFTRSRRPGIEAPASLAAPVAAENPSTPLATTGPVKEITTPVEKPAPVTAVTPAPPPPKPERFLVVTRNDSIIGRVGEKSLKRFRDSVGARSKDTLLMKTGDTIVIKPFVPKQVYKPSRYVYTERDGNVAIALPEAGEKDYLVKFFEDNNDPLFEVKSVKEKYLLLEKANFLHAGWFKFELYEDGKLKEKQKFFIPKDF